MSAEEFFADRDHVYTFDVRSLYVFLAELMQVAPIISPSGVDPADVCDLAPKITFQSFHIQKKGRGR